jgi:hypothetical protein
MDAAEGLKVEKKRELTGKLHLSFGPSEDTDPTKE